MESAFNLKSFRCKRHPENVISGVILTDATRKTLLLCKDCKQNHTQKVLDLGEYIDRAFKASNSKLWEEVSTYPKRATIFEDAKAVVEDQGDITDELIKHIEKEKAIVDEAFKALRSQIFNFLEIEKTKFLGELDQQVRSFHKIFNQGQRYFQIICDREKRQTFSKVEKFVEKFNKKEKT